ncbi:MAG: TetR/AcrR family transcriptional regulator [Chloroflexi bacterium]|nr:TetR/AcrR family transcriptional regulator [Chloroflexota bacterium]
MTERKSGTARNQKPTPADITIDDLSIAGMNKKASARLLQIVQVAADLFHKKGYGPTTTRDIGEACNISPGHLYYYIKSKDDFPAIFKQIHDNDVTRWEKSVRREMKRLLPEKLLEKAVRDYARLTHDRRRVIAFWYHAQTQVRDEDRLGTMEAEKRVDDVFQEIIERGNKEGQFHVSDPFILAINILMMCQTWALKRWLIKDQRTIDQYTDVIVDLIITMAKGNQESRPRKL